MPSQRPSAPRGDQGDVVLQDTLCPADSSDLVAQKKERLDLPEMANPGTILKPEIVQEKDAKPVATTDFLPNPRRFHIYLKPFRYSPLTCRSSGR